MISNRITEQLTAFDWSKAVTKRYGNKEYVFFEGDEKRWLYRVSSGTVSVSRTRPDGGRQIFGFQSHDDILGLESGGEYALSAQALGKVELNCLPFNPLKEQSARNAEIALQLYDAISMELAATRDFVEMLCHLDSTGRIAFFLLDLYRRNSAEPRNVIYLPMSRGDIADFLSIKIETLSRALAKLSRDNLIEVKSRSTIVVKDADGLERAAASAPLEDREN
jgi:CRP-like cAMP-binding protein